MISRRLFSACAICAAISGVTSAEAAGEPGPSDGKTIKRAILSKTEHPDGRLATILMAVEIPEGVEVPRHTHPGIESAFVVAGAGELYVQGKDDVKFSAGQGFQIPTETPHGVRNVTERVKLAITYVVDKDKPLLSPAPA